MKKLIGLCIGIVILLALGFHYRESQNAYAKERAIKHAGHEAQHAALREAILKGDTRTILVCGDEQELHGVLGKFDSDGRGALLVRRVHPFYTVGASPTKLGLLLDAHCQAVPYDDPRWKDLAGVIIGYTGPVR